MSPQTTGRKGSPEPKGSRPHIPGYGIPKTLKGLLPWSFVDERMRKSVNYWVCTAGADGQPHARPVWGVWVEGAICFGGHGVRWDRNLAANPAVTVHLESGDEVVILEGTAKRITDPKDPMVGRFAQASKAKYKMGGGVPFWILRPRVAFAWTTSKKFKDATRWRLDVSPE